MASESYPAAKKRLMDALEESGWRVKRNQKVPRADELGFTTLSLWFKPQSVYAALSVGGRPPSMGSARSLNVDIRGLSYDDFLDDVSAFFD